MPTSRRNLPDPGGLDKWWDVFGRTALRGSGAAMTPCDLACGEEGVMSAPLPLRAEPLIVAVACCFTVSTELHGLHVESS
jgi:hypothetical protein